MTRRAGVGKRVVVTCAVVAVALVVAAMVVKHKLKIGEVNTISGTITYVDAEARTAALEVVRPKTGESLEIEGTVAPGCEITIDGKPAELGALEVGDRAEVTGTIGWNLALSASRVAIARVSASQPAATQSAEGP